MGKILNLWASQPVGREEGVHGASLWPLVISSRQPARPVPATLTDC